MKTFRKALSIILGLAIMLSCIAGMQVSVAAEGTLALSVGEATVADGVVTVPVVANGSFQALGITVSYDGAVLKLDGAEKADLDVATNDSATSSPLTANPFVMQWAFAEETTDVVVAGTIATLTFNVVEGANLDEATAIDLEVTEAWDVAGNEVTATVENGVVTFACEHSYAETSRTDATTSANGSVTKTCSKCGDVVTEVIPRTLAFAGAQLGLENNISMIYNVDSGYASLYTDLYVEFQLLDNEPVIVREYTTNSKGQLVFTFRGVRPQEMNDNVDAVLYGTYNGKTYQSAVQPFSIATYCKKALAVTKTDAVYVRLKRLVVDLLYYGAAKQVYANYNTDALVTDAVLTDPSYAGYGTTGNPTYSNIANTSYVVNPNAAVTFTGAQLELTDAVKVKINFSSAGTAFTGAAGEIDGYYVKITAVDNVSGDDLNWTIPYDANNTEIWSYSGGKYYFLFDELKARQFSTEVYYTIYDANDNAVSHTLLHSVESYVRLAHDRMATNTKLINVVDTMMNYGDSAYYYATAGKEIVRD